MVELLKCVNAVLYNTDEKFKITPSLFSAADKNKMLPFLCVSFDTYTTTEKMQKLLFMYILIINVRFVPFTTL